MKPALVNAVLVGAGGFLGALARYGLSGLVHRLIQTSFPHGTLVVNLLGCFTIGIVAGLGLSLAGARWLESFLFGVSPRDPVAFVGAALSLAIVGVMASYIPARRTGRIDPIETLRAE